MAIADHSAEGGRARAARLSPARRREIARRAALARWGGDVAGVPVLEIGRRIEANAKNPLADALRASYWKARGGKTWRRICRNSLRERCSSSWIAVVRRLGRA
ncbi:MAG: hypothetical protein HY721_24780 [Planctomycetes bacterium]|nr:hypothetical protein [Planctomycetota bacterium]